MTKPSLLARLQDWNQQTAWRDFDQNYAPLLRNLALKAGLTEDEAKDVVQDTLLTVAKKIPQFHHSGNPGAFRAWLYQQARWRIKDQFRARRRAGRCGNQKISSACSGKSPESAPDDKVDECNDNPAFAETKPTVDPAFESIWDAEWQAHCQRLALARVRQKVSLGQFQLFDLHVLQGLSASASAKAAGTTIAAVYMAKSRVGRMLKREMAATTGH